MRSVAVEEPTRRTPSPELEFVGCTPHRVTAAAIDGPEWEGRRIEYWHAATETAWTVREPTSQYHEVPSRRLVALVERICLARGSTARCFGSTDLRVRRADGTLGDLMQADEAVYLHPGEAKLPRGAQWIAGEDDHPDVVLEVDNTTDVRRGKLFVYAEWGVPEVWVEVPEDGSVSRPRSLRPGLAIYLLDGDGYRRSEESRAFPGWRARDIHRALNEPAMTAETAEILWRVGRTLGEREGTRPENDPLLGRYGQAQHDKGVATGVAKGVAAMARAMLDQRGVTVSDGFAAKLSARQRPSLDAVLEAASSAEDEADFFACLD